MTRGRKRTLMLAAGVVVFLASAFLYLMPPLTLVPQEEFIRPQQSAGPDLDVIANPAERLLAQRGHYLVRTHGCTDCHTPQGERGPVFDRFLSGGNMLATRKDGSIISANLTADRETGLGDVDPAAVKRALRSGIHHSGRPMSYRAMPWGGFSQWSEEDLHAVVTYLRRLPAVHRNVPVPGTLKLFEVPFNAEVFFPGDFQVPSSMQGGGK